ncbi:MAG: tetratricopeptide repeat protein [Phototrophicaceae bacterium]
MPYTALQLAEAHLQGGDLAESLVAIHTHLQQFPHDPHGLRLRSQLLMHTDQQDDLQQALHDLQQLETPNWQDIQRMAVLHEKLGNPQQALAVVQQALDHDPHERLKGYQLELYRRMGQLEDALRLAQHAGWGQWVGELALELGDYPLAQSAWTGVIESLHAHGVALSGLGLNQLWRAYWNRGLAHAYLQQWEQALADFEEAIVLSVADLQLVRDALDMIAQLHLNDPHYPHTLSLADDQLKGASQLPSRFQPDHTTS